MNQRYAGTTGHCRNSLTPQTTLPAKRSGAFARLMLMVTAAILVLAASPPARTAPTPAVDPEAQSLVRELTSQRPDRELSVDAVLKIRRGNGRRSEVPVKYSMSGEDREWQSNYHAATTEFQGPEELVIIHRPVGPNTYRFTQISIDGAKTNALVLQGAEAAISFAGSDFWLTDLGLEFLRWPEQRLVREAKIKMRLGRPCHVLESINPRPVQGTYARVVSWIDIETGGLIRAEAYDTSNRRYKVFSISGFKRVDGRWEVKNVEIVNERADTKTQLEFQFQERP